MMNSRNSLLLLGVVTAFLCNTTLVHADSGMPDKVAFCTSCHGAIGISNYDLWPNIAGQKRAYLARQLQAFRDGSRHDPWMTPMAVPLSDAEIEELAEFYSKL